MSRSRVLLPLMGGLLLSLAAACRTPSDSESTPAGPSAPAPAVVELPGIDTSDLTPREKAEWSAHVSEQMAPCPEVAQSVAECVTKKSACGACEPAARFLLAKVRTGLSRGQVSAAYKARFSAEGIHQIDLQGSPSRGPGDAQITVVEWADFECPACRAASPLIEAVLKKHSDVRFVFKNFPLDVHPNAEQAARAAVAADLQGKFWEMHHELFTAETPLTKERIAEVAKKLGLDMARFDKDLRSEAAADAVLRDKRQGDQVGLKGTPTLFINGREFEFSSDLDKEMGEWFALERQLAKPKTAAAAPGAP